MDREFADNDAPATLELEGQSRRMSDLVRALACNQTPLGDEASWPPSLKTPVRIMLTSRFPMWMCWGPEFTMLYNDAYARVTLGNRCCRVCMPHYKLLQTLTTRTGFRGSRTGSA